MKRRTFLSFLAYSATFTHLIGKQAYIFQNSERAKALSDAGNVLLALQKQKKNANSTMVLKLTFRPPRPATNCRKCSRICERDLLVCRAPPISSGIICAQSSLRGHNARSYSRQFILLPGACSLICFAAKSEARAIIKRAIA